MASCADENNTQKFSLGGSGGGGIQGPRPSPLKIGKSSSKIKKKPPQHPTGNPVRRPVIIYIRSPEVIHVEACNFMKLVQQLTGNSSSSSSYSSKSNDTIGCNSIQVVEDIVEACEVPVAEEMDPGLLHDVLGEGYRSNFMRGMFPSVLNIPPSASSSSPLMISPNLYDNMQDFGMISYSHGYHDIVSTYPKFNP